MSTWHLCSFSGIYALHSFSGKGERPSLHEKQRALGAVDFFSDPTTEISDGVGSKGIPSERMEKAPVDRSNGCHSFCAQHTRRVLFYGVFEMKTFTVVLET